MDTNNNIGKKIKGLREERGITQEGFYELTGIDKSVLSKLENGKLNPSISYLENIAKAFDKKLDVNFNKITKMKTIKSNKDLEYLISTIRMALNQAKFESDKEIDAYFRSAILIFNNLNEPYWKGEDNGKINYDDYFQSKMDITFNNDKQGVINQLHSLWINKTVTSIEYNLRGLEFILREHSHELTSDILINVAKTLKPLIIRAEKAKDMVIIYEN